MLVLTHVNLSKTSISLKGIKSDKILFGIGGRTESGKATAERWEYCPLHVRTHPADWGFKIVYHKLSTSLNCWAAGFPGNGLYVWFCFMLFCLLHKTFGKVRSKPSSQICVGFSFVCFFFFLYVWVFLCAHEWELLLFHQLYIEHHQVMFFGMYSLPQRNFRDALLMCSIWKPWGTSHSGVGG